MSKRVTIQIQPAQPGPRVSRYLYGHFAEHLGRCIYNGLWVGEGSSIPNDAGIRQDTATALRKLTLPVLRWPGGCFADNYHWIDGVGPREQRPRRANLHWAQGESNHFGTDEFMRLCQVLDTEPYICLNVGSGTVEEARAWVEYCNASQRTTLSDMRAANGHEAPYNVKFWGIGNENWGCGGMMRAEHYADLYAQFASYVRLMAGPGAKLIACGSHPTIPDWDRRFLESLEYSRHWVDYIALHNYAGLGTGVNSLEFERSDYLRLVIDFVDSLDSHIGRAAGITRAYSTKDHTIGVILDEWGTWYADATVENGLYQQNTMQDALFTAASFHCFHEHANHLFMANMAQTVNVLQSLVLTEGPKMVITPTYHVYDLYQPHRDGLFVHAEVTGAPTIESSSGMQRASLSASATVSDDGKSVFLSVVNLDPESDMHGSVSMADSAKWRIVSAQRLGTGDLHSYNTFEQPEAVIPVALPVAELAINDMTFPRLSITTLELAFG